MLKASPTSTRTSCTHDVIGFVPVLTSIRLFVARLDALHYLSACTRRSFPPTIVNWFVSQVLGAAVSIFPPSRRKLDLFLQCFCFLIIVSCCAQVIRVGVYLLERRAAAVAVKLASPPPAPSANQSSFPSLFSRVYTAAPANDPHVDRIRTDRVFYGWLERRFADFMSDVVGLKVRAIMSRDSFLFGHRATIFYERHFASGC